MTPDFRAALDAQIDRLTEDAITLTRDMVRCDSQSPPSDTRDVLAVLRRSLAGLPGIEVIDHCRSEPIHNLVIRLRGTRPGAKLILSGHLDTYPIGAPDDWSRPALSGDIVEDRLYGRGSCDMKGGIAAALAVLRFLAGTGAEFPGELLLALAGDEETMGELGTQAMIEDLDLWDDGAVIIPDVGAPQIPRLGEKGMLWVRLTAQGRSSHGAHVHRGDNAIRRLQAALVELDALEGLRMPSDHPAAEVMAQAEPLSEPLGGTGEREVMSRVTVNLGTFAGGTSPNLVPDHAQAELDIRIPLGVSVAEVEAMLARILTDHPQVTYEVLRAYEPSWTSATHAVSRAVQTAAEECYPGAVALNMRVGASDARLWRRAGHATVVAGLTPYNLGAPDENLDLRELPELIRVLVLASVSYLEAQSKKLASCISVGCQGK